MSEFDATVQMRSAFGDDMGSGGMHGNREWCSAALAQMLDDLEPGQSWEICITKTIPPDHPLFGVATGTTAPDHQA